MFEGYLNIIEAGERLGIHPESVRRLIRYGRLSAQKIAGQWFIKQDALETFINSRDPKTGKIKA